MKYTIFPTKWGHFGLAGSEKGLLRTHLPIADPDKLKRNLLANLDAEYDSSIFDTLQSKIIAYFEGTYIDFSMNIPVILPGFSPFAVQIYNACRKIPFARTASYSRLAKTINRPKSARAVGAVMAKNPLPLIIPCHRVIRSNGQLGGFSATPGPPLKQKLLNLEKKYSTKKAASHETHSPLVQILKVFITFCAFSSKPTRLNQVGQLLQAQVLHLSGR